MPRNTAQQLYDVGYVVYGGERQVGGGREKKKRKGAGNVDKEIEIEKE